MPISHWLVADQINFPSSDYFADAQHVSDEEISFLAMKIWRLSDFLKTREFFDCKLAAA